MISGNGKKDMLDRRHDMLQYIREYTSNISMRKNYSSECFPYKVHNSLDILGKKSGYDGFALVGDNWLDKQSDKPIALIFGMNNWKLGFVSEYLHEYRAAFAPRKYGILSLLLDWRKIKKKPTCFIVWGYNGPRNLGRFAQSQNIPLMRMEDGFLRSSLLGAIHTTPYSLVLDKSGLYYNSNEESELEQILNNHDFDNDPELLSKARQSIALVVRLKLSKYSLPTTTSEEGVAVVTKRRVAVLGQVDGDAAVRLGNPDGWRAQDIVSLAKFENPDAEIVYRPHPEVYKGYQRSALKQRHISKIATISPPTGSLVEFLETVDHVYVLNSLSGLEALLRGKKVTVLGAAFYAGWGLTDDRAQMERRDRTLSLEALFAGIYFIYPRYLANLEDSAKGFTASCYRISADRFAETYSLHKDSLTTILDEGSHGLLDDVITSDFWPLLLMKQDKLSEQQLAKIVAGLDYQKLFFNGGGKLYQVAVMYFVIGCLKSDDNRNAFLTAARRSVDTDVFNDLLIDLCQYFPGPYLLGHFQWLVEDATNEIPYKVALNFNPHIEVETKEGEKEKQIDDPFSSYRNDKNFSHLIGHLRSHVLHYDLDSFISEIKPLLLASEARRKVNSILFPNMVEMARQIGDLGSARALSSFLQRMNLLGHNFAGVNSELESLDFDSHLATNDDVMQKIALQMRLNPDRINRTWGMLKGYLGKAETYDAFASMINLNGDCSLRQATALMEINQPEKALRLIEDLLDNGESSDRTYVKYAQALASSGQVDKAWDVVRKAMARQATQENYTEFLRLVRAHGNFDEGLRVARDGLDKNIGLTVEGHLMPICFGAGEIEEGFKCFLQSPLKEKLVRAFGGEKYRDHEGFEDFDDTLLIFSSGPAEEMRFASIYNELVDAVGHTNFKITCDHRLMSLLSRSFPKIAFVPVKRSRFFTTEYPVSLYDRLPGTDLCNALDNDALEEVNQASQIKLYTEYLYRFRKSYKDFEGHKAAYLQVDQDRVAEFEARLPKGNRLVGICWRSSLTSALRNIHYLDVEELEPVFKIPGITFVNLQYDECAHELDYIRDQYGVDIVDFDDLDQTNDFERVAALMKNLDLVISPATAVIELAGAIGVQGWLFSNHCDAAWRRTDEEGSDVWYDNVRIVGEGRNGDRQALVSTIVRELNSYFGEN